MTCLFQEGEPRWFVNANEQLSVIATRQSCLVVQVCSAAEYLLVRVVLHLRICPTPNRLPPITHPLLQPNLHRKAHTVSSSTGLWRLRCFQA